MSDTLDTPAAAAPITLAIPQTAPPQPALPPPPDLAAPPDGNGVITVTAPAQPPTEPPPMTRWQQAMWAAVGLGLAASAAAVFWGVATIFLTLQNWLASVKTEDHYLIAFGVMILTFSSIRLVAILIGAALAFAGLLVSFLTISQSITASARRGEGVNSASGMFSTNSPGVAAIIVGAVVMVSALFRTTDARYAAPETMFVAEPEASVTAVDDTTIAGQRKLSDAAARAAAGDAKKAPDLATAASGVRP
jgi:hypothetical protein